jgi:hypothetical protein
MLASAGDLDSQARVAPPDFHHIEATRRLRPRQPGNDAFGHAIIFPALAVGHVDLQARVSSRYPIASISLDRSFVSKILLLDLLDEREPFPERCRGRRDFSSLCCGAAKLSEAPSDFGGVSTRFLYIQYCFTIYPFVNIG